jgi:hypothetical protein
MTFEANALPGAFIIGVEAVILIPVNFAYVGGLFVQHIVHGTLHSFDIFLIGIFVVVDVEWVAVYAGYVEPDIFEAVQSGQSFPRIFA